jgi:hypothetical protein
MKTLRDTSGSRAARVRAHSIARAILPHARIAALATAAGLCWTPGGEVAAQVDAPPDTALDANEAGDAFGSAVASGDFNGDGFLDLVVAAPNEAVAADPDDAPGVRAGTVFVYLGGPTGLRPGQRIDQSEVGTNEDGDRFASALAAGDFDADGIDDLAIGVPGEALQGGPRSGFVFVFRGSAQGLVFQAGIDQTSVAIAPGVRATNDAGDRFGAALAAADFNGDDVTDLAVGAPGEAVVPGVPSGAVFVFRGARGDGLGGDQVLTQGAALLDELGDNFGSALAAGDLNRDGRADLAVGIPQERVLLVGPQAGAVALFRGDANGLVMAGMFEQADALGGLGEIGDLFGSAITIADFDGDDRTDVAVGAPGESVGAIPSVGSVSFYRGNIDGAFNPTLLDQSDVGANEAGDRFGASLTAGDLDGDGRGDLVVGAPGETIQGTPRAGAAYTFAGAVGGVTPAQALDATRLGALRADDGFGTALIARDFDGDGRADLAVGAPNGTPGGAGPRFDAAADAPRSGTVAVFQGVASGVRADRALDQERARALPRDAGAGVGAPMPPAPPAPRRPPTLANGRAPAPAAASVSGAIAEP